MKHRTLLKVFIFSAIAFGVYWFNRSGLLHSMIGGLDGLGAARPYVFLFVYILAAVFLMPSWILTFAGGFLFDFRTAVLLSILGSGLAAIITFLIGRYLARRLVEKWAARIPEFGRISKMVAKKGWKIVLLARLSPIFPFSAGNYAFGITRMKARHYFFASIAGTIPSAFVYTYSGSLAGSLAQAGSRARTNVEWAFLALGLAASIAISLYLRRLAMAELREAGKNPHA